MADTVSDAQTLYSEALDCLRTQREQIADDLKFSDPSDPQQWDDVEKRRRETDPGGMRPCLVFDQCGQYVANVAGQVEQRPPSLHALPVGGGADKKTAEQLDGHFRHIEHASKAQQHYARSATSAARAGVGYLVVRPEYVDRALGYQEPRIGSEGDPMRVILDPYSVELDGSDARFGFILQPISGREFKRRWPKAEAVSFGDQENYRARKDDRDNIIVAEYWQMDEEEGNCVIFLGMDGEEIALPEDQFWEAKQRGQVLRILGTYKEKKSAVTWRRLSGAAVLDKSEGKDGKEAAFPADHIGIIPVYGYVGFSDGRMTYCGIPRRARMSQQAYNYHMSEARAYTATAPKAPWVASVRALSGFESLWDKASVESRAYLPYNDLDNEGPISQPQRMAVSADVRNHMQGAEQALRDIQSSLGLYQANLGAPSNETSGVAIESRKQQGEASTAHFQTHLAASVAHAGNICLQMVQRLVDTRRQLRILSIDSQPSTITINPQQQSSVEETPQGLSINPNVGRYDVRVVVGAAYSGQSEPGSGHCPAVGAGARCTARGQTGPGADRDGPA
jgi:Phage P22-like portal protein